jgi:hypothetical protein
LPHGPPWSSTASKEIFLSQRGIVGKPGFSSGEVSSWEYVGEPGFSHSYVNEVAFAISPLGIPYIAFTDHGNEHKATVMKTSFEP